MAPLSKQGLSHRVVDIITRACRCAEHNAPIMICRSKMSFFLWKFYKANVASCSSVNALVNSEHLSSESKVGLVAHDMAVQVIQVILITPGGKDE